MATWWAQQCQSGGQAHGQPDQSLWINLIPQDWRTFPSPVGQNTFAGTGSPAPTFQTAIQSWYDEKLAYNYDTGACSAICGHYTAVSPREIDNNIFVNK